MKDCIECGAEFGTRTSTNKCEACRMKNPAVLLAKKSWESRKGKKRKKAISEMMRKVRNGQRLTNV